MSNEYDSKMRAFKEQIPQIEKALARRKKLAILISLQQQGKYERRAKKVCRLC